MDKQDAARLGKYLDGLIRATADAKLAWSQVNPTTYVWSGPDKRITLQRIESVESITTPKTITTGVVLGGLLSATKVVVHYVLQGEASGQPSIILNGKDEAELNSKLKALYEAIAVGQTRRTIDFLKGIVGEDLG